jgi:uncharacterized membrane protein
MAMNKGVSSTFLTDECAQKMAIGLGFFSFGLGLAELLTPRAVAWVCGVESKNANLIRLYGLRELQAGALIFSQGKKPAQSMWLRVAGDALDLASLGIASLSPKSSKGRLLFATANVLAVTALDVLTAQKLSESKGWTTEDGSIRVCQQVFINRSPQECYEYWRNLENLPTFMRHLVSVSIKDKGRSSWVAKGPAGARVAWEAEIVQDTVNEAIVWRSLPGSLIGNRGSVKFKPAPGGRGTYLIVELQYSPPAGMLGVGVAKLFREEPKMQLKDDLRRFKQIIEVGEIILSDASPEGNGNLKQRPAQPVER